MVTFLYLWCREQRYTFYGRPGGESVSLRRLSLVCIESWPGYSDWISFEIQLQTLGLIKPDNQDGSDQSLTHGQLRGP